MYLSCRIQQAGNGVPRLSNPLLLYIIKLNGLCVRLKLVLFRCFQTCDKSRRFITFSTSPCTSSFLLISTCLKERVVIWLGPGITVLLWNKSGYKLSQQLQYINTTSVNSLTTSVFQLHQVVPATLVYYPQITII